MLSVQSSKVEVDVRRRLGWLPCGIGLVVAVVAAANLFATLGASRLFVDESFSWIVASHPLRDLYSEVKLSEVAPPGYYAFLHVWLNVSGSSTETWMRIPSAIAGLLLVAATAWLAWLAGGRRAAAVAAALVAVSPLVLTYGQQLRAYVFVMLATTLAVAAAVRATQHVDRRMAWMVASGVFAVAAIWLHYTCLPVLIPLAVWVVTRGEFSRRARGAYVAALLVAQAVVTPLLLHQASTGNPGADAYAHFSFTNLVSVLGNPADGQYASHLAALIIATATIAAGTAILLTCGPRDQLSWLLIAAAVLPPLALLAMTIAAKPVLISRYCTVAAPFALVVLSVAFARRPLVGAVPVLAFAAIAIIGSVRIHEPGSHWPAVGSAYATAGAQWKRSDRFVLSNGIDPILTSAPLVIYYTQRYLPGGTMPITDPSPARLLSLLRHHRRLWLVNSSDIPAAIADRFLRPYGYRVRRVWRYRSSEPIQLTLAVPG